MGVRSAIAERDVLYLQGIVHTLLLGVVEALEEHGGLLAETVGILGGQEFATATFRASPLYLGVVLEVELQRLGYIFALCNDAYARRHVFLYLGQQNRVVGAA